MIIVFGESSVWFLELLKFGVDFRVEMLMGTKFGL